MFEHVQTCLNKWFFFVFSIASPRNERVEQARQVLQSEVVQEASEEDKPSTPTTTLSLEERVERAKRLLADKQAQKVELVSKELNHFGVIAGLFRQIGGHSM